MADPERTGEVRRVRETPALGDVGDAHVVPSRVEKVVTSHLEAAGAQPPTEGDTAPSPPSPATRTPSTSTFARRRLCSMCRGSLSETCAKSVLNSSVNASSPSTSTKSPGARRAWRPACRTTAAPANGRSRKGRPRAPARCGRTSWSRPRLLRRDRPRSPGPRPRTTGRTARSPEQPPSTSAGPADAAVPQPPGHLKTCVDASEVSRRERWPPARSDVDDQRDARRRP